MHPSPHWKINLYLLFLKVIYVNVNKKILILSQSWWYMLLTPAPWRFIFSLVHIVSSRPISTKQLDPVSKLTSTFYPNFNISSGNSQSHSFCDLIPSDGFTVMSGHPDDVLHTVISG